MPRSYRKRDHGKYGPLMTLEHFNDLVDKEIEDEHIDTAIDALWLDLLGIYLDCTFLKQNMSIREWFSPNQPHPWFEEAGEHVAETSYYEKQKPPRLTDEQECWREMRRSMRDSQAPLPLSVDLARRIKMLPERDVTLYIRLDEQVPRNSCTAYEVDWKGFTRQKKTENLFTIFRLCSRPKNATRAECLVGTLASACLHPYTVVPPNILSFDDQDGEPSPRTATVAPFRPKRVLLDRPEDVCTAELQWYLTRMGMAECHEVHPKLRLLHDAEELDFFPTERGDFFQVPSVATILENNHRSTRAGSCVSTSLPFVCLDGEDDLID